MDQLKWLKTHGHYDISNQRFNIEQMNDYSEWFIASSWSERGTYDLRDRMRQ
jgi:hypothetical protein